MPGTITHNRVLIESINYLKKDKQKNIFSKSIEALFNSESFLKAGLFGAIGPNIFNYLPFIKNNYISGSEISYELHSSRSEVFLKSIFNTLLSYKDKDTEWSSTIRAYLYGLISHYISDSIFHPFIYFWSGFSNSSNKNDLIYFREQHLLFENNIDIYFTTNNEIDNYKFEFNLENMLPAANHAKYWGMDYTIKILLFNSIKAIYPDFFKGISFINNKNEKRFLQFNIFDIIPSLIRFSYEIKKSRNIKLIKLTNFCRKKNLLLLDCLIYYPPMGKINTHVLNLHKERWFHPSGTSGLHYESVKDLLLLSCKQITNTWQKIEEILYLHPEDRSEVENKFKIDAFTGISGKDYYSMYLQKPNRLRIQ